MTFLIEPDVIAGVIGYPIKHSRSPLIHNHWLDACGMEGTYAAIEVAPEALGDFCAAARTSTSIKGFNVTLPHKETIMGFCDEIEDTAQKIGAVNTVRVEDGRLYGSNTDAYGFIQNLKMSVPDFDIKSADVLVLGAGGAARAVLYGLQIEGTSSITLTNRTRDKAEALAQEFGCIEVRDWEVRTDLLRQADLIINTTSLGMMGQPPLTFERFDLKPGAVAYDLVYNPLQTDLLKQAAGAGGHAVGGLGMLLYQAEAAFHSWFAPHHPTVTEDLSAQIEASL